MSLPRDMVFPDNEMSGYLQTMYLRLSENINGKIRSYADNDSSVWTPTFTPASNITYSQQVGWIFRQGLLTDIWFDIIFTNNTESSFSLMLPYKVIKTQGNPFVGFLVSPSGLFISAQSNSYEGLIINNSFVSTPISSGRVCGYLRYLGVEGE